MVAAIVGAETLPPVPQDEHDLAGLLYPESAWMFVWGRRLLRDVVGERVSRFLIGRLDAGCWSVLCRDAAWLAVRCADDVSPAAPVHVVSSESAQDALAYAAAGLMADEGVAVTSHLLQDLGLLRHEPDDLGFRRWTLTEQGAAMASVSQRDGHARYGDGALSLNRALGRIVSYVVLPADSAAGGGPSLKLHDVLTALALHHLPDDFGVSTGEELPKGKMLKGYGSTDERYLFTLDTPFERMRLAGNVEQYARHLYVLRHPLRTYPGFPVNATTVPMSGTERMREPSTGGRGYLLPNSIASLLGTGDLFEVSPWEGGRLLKNGTALR
ncbi:hypothetical protein BJF79_25455 [Actinomadura sp. CNU-125]|uniref:hypothetical protein n=1 Tax=Actinomadura sp. CNU-125 TaxID=1904961 RepID=UPI00095E2DDC|nr:hypothetical protein [Actinomadura sp. CNU-125]OLT10821.1 hypothetical protein BJF79_25455 [Actinomadura sp. CNU-125]